jgi:hypothetical protein
VEPVSHPRSSRQPNCKIAGKSKRIRHWQGAFKAGLTGRGRGIGANFVIFFVPEGLEKLAR